MTEEQNNDQGMPQPQPQPQQPVEPAYQQPPMAQPVPPQPQPQPQQPPMYAPQPQPQPVYAPAPLMQLTGGMKFAWLVIGALMGIPGIIIAWLVNVDKMPQVKSDALKFSIIGFVIWIVLGFLIGLMFAGMMATIVAGATSYGHGYYGTW